MVIGLWSLAEAQTSSPCPTAFSGTAASPTAIEWTWTPPTQTDIIILYYVIYNADNGTPLQYVPPSASSYREENLLENTQYRRYAVTWFYRIGWTPVPIPSTPSNTAERYTKVHNPLIGDFTAEYNPTSKGIRVVVTPPPNPTADQTGVEITYRDGNGANTVIPFPNTYTPPDITGVTPGATYSIRIQFRNGDGITTLISYAKSVVVPADVTLILDPRNLESYLPEGDPTGDETCPSAVDKDLIVDCHWEGGVPNEARKIYVRLETSTLPGSCTNFGTRRGADFVLEELRNEAWTVTGTDYPYENRQTLEAETKVSVQAGVIVPLHVTSYDWGGHVTVIGSLERCDQHPEVKAPKDSDEDNLPDLFEVQSQYYTATRELKTFNPYEQHSDGLQVSRDDLDDSDLDARNTPKQTQFGDGFSAFTEYRGFKVLGRVQRSHDLPNDGPAVELKSFGTHVKDVFVYDEMMSTTTPFFPPDNVYLKDHMMAWHLIARDEMSNETTGYPYPNHATYPTGGFMSRSEGQRAVYLGLLTPMELVLLPKEARSQWTNMAGITLGSTINKGAKVLINPRFIAKEATLEGFSADDGIAHVVSHEVSHTMTLDHPQDRRPYSIGTPTSSDISVWWKGATLDRLFSSHPIRPLRAAGFSRLEIPVHLETALGAWYGDVIRTNEYYRWPQASVVISGIAHTAWVFHSRVDQLVAPLGMILLVESHTVNLMDPVDDPGDWCRVTRSLPRVFPN